MLAFLLHTAASSQLPKVNDKSDGDAAIYFDILVCLLNYFFKFCFLDYIT